MGKFSEKVHYVMILDNSGSMQGKPWNDLMSCFGDFLSALANNQHFKANSKVTAITYAGRAT